MYCKTSGASQKVSRGLNTSANVNEISRKLEEIGKVGKPENNLKIRESLFT